MAKKSRKSTLPGSIYLNKNRWWWKVKLPGENKVISRPLKPVGAKFATKDRSVAEEVAREMLQCAVFQSGRTTEDTSTIAGLVNAYLEYARKYYKGPDGKTTREPENIRYAVMPLVVHCSTLPVEEFGPLRLKEIRQKMIGLNWCRGVINQRIGIIKRMFKWAVSEQLIPASVYQSLQTVEGLKRGRSGARETKAVEPIAESHVRAVLPFTTPTVAAMVELQLLTGMRSGELVIMRPCDIETIGEIWLYRPSRHKTSYRGHKRVVCIGPHAQKILKPFLTRKLTDYCFTPIESQEQRKGGAKIIHDRYDKDSYRHAVQYAIKAANRTIQNKKDKMPHWTPHQLRHTAATRIRKEMGLDAARAMLGHRNLRITDDYAELDQGLASKAALKFG